VENAVVKQVNFCPLKDMLDLKGPGFRRDIFFFSFIFISTYSLYMGDSL
jgi:hypothetical protein